MSFRVPGEELDFTICGGAHTNHLQLSPVQLSKLHMQSRVNNGQEGPDLTGYQSGIFDKDLGSRSSRERREKKRSSIAFVDQHPPSRTSSQQRHQQHMNPQQPLALKERPIPSFVLSPVTDQNDELGGTLDISPSFSSPLRHPYKHKSLSPSTTFPANGYEGVNDQGKHVNNSNPLEKQEEVIHDLEVLEALPIPTLRPSLARSSTIISTTSSSGRPRLTHRLSYLTHMDDLESEGKENEEETTTTVTVTTTASDKTESYTAPSRQSTPSTSASSTGPHAVTRVVVSPEQQTASNISSRPSPMSFRPSTAARQPPSSASSEYTTANKAALPPASHPPSQVVAPPIPKLYKRLLRVFRPPSDSSDSDTGGVSAHQGRAPSKHRHHSHRHHHQHQHHHTPVPEPVAQARGPFGLPSNPENSSRGGPMSLPSKKTPVEKPVVILPAQAAVLAQKTPPESTGFRARFLRKLMSSPNLSTSAFQAPAAVVAPPVPIATRADALKMISGPEKAAKLEGVPLSPLQSDFEHDQTCPAGQRIKDQKKGMRRRASTVPRTPPSMPTLQSKYGVPGRELGAGTQAQVMLLRVKSTKRLRSSFPVSHKNKNAVQPPSSQLPSRSTTPTVSPLTSATIVIQDRPSPRSVTPVDPSSLLIPRSRTGTLMTTTEDEVTPEQREAYRKRLLRRTSTGGVSMNQNGGLIYAIKKFRPPKATETHRQYLKKVCAEFCISTSMDHENIIRTIDLVRDQPGHELLDDENADGPYSDAKRPQRAMSRSSILTTREEGSGGAGNDDVYDCNCPRAHRRTRTLKCNNGDPTSASRSNSGANTPHQGVGGPSAGTSSFPTKIHRPIQRKSVISKPQRKRSVDSNRGSDGTLTPQGSNSRVQGYFNQNHLSSQNGRAHVGTEPSAQAIAAAKKKRQQQEQELRQQEVQRLKAQRQREKLQAKQQRLDQFPEYCMVMEFAAGGDLFNLLTKAHPPITLNEKHCLWRQLVNGVQYMHSMGVAHRDLKPENILIDGSGRILKITDFGIANVFKSVGDPTPLPCKGIIGSEPYIAPEEFFQEEYDPRAVDVWACGIIFYVMFYSAMPWARADRKKDARYARYVTDITNHRYSEAQRRLQFDRRHLYGNNTHSTSSSSGGGRSDSLNKPHEVNHHRQFPPYKPSDIRIPKHNANIKVVASSTATSSSNSGSPTSPGSQGETVTPNSSTESSPVSAFKPTTGNPLDWPSITIPTSAASAMTPPAVYNTYAYNGYIGGHEFIDRIEIPGCRRILYAIMEPDPKKRLTIDQVQADEWMSKVRFCSDESEKPTLQQQRDHHRHFQPKPVRN